MENEELDQKKEQSEKRTKKVVAEILDWTYCIVLAVVITLLIKNLVFSTTIVRKESMVPTLQDGNILMVNRFALVTKQPLERGDIVVIEAPMVRVADSNYAYYKEDTFIEKVGKLFKKNLYIKRVIGLPGEHLVIDDAIVYINGEAIEEEYINGEWIRLNSGIEIEIPEGYIYCMGDNRNVSLDSRELGLIPIEKVEGTASFRLFPFDKFGNIE